MKKFWNLSELKRLLIVSAIVGVVLTCGSLFTLAFNSPGWTIGIAIGTVVEIVNIFLLYKGSEAALKSYKASIFLLCYFTRMVLFLGSFILCAALQWKAHVEPFYWSIFGVLIGLTPMQIVVTVVMTKNKKNPVTISKENKVEEPKE